MASGINILNDSEKGTDICYVRTFSYETNIEKHERISN